MSIDRHTTWPPRDHRFDRRTFLQRGLAAGGAACLGGTLLGPSRSWGDDSQEKLPVAAIVTEYRQNSHADVLVTKILEGYRHDGGRGPGLRLASLYTDQVPQTDKPNRNDLSRALAEKHGFPIAKTIDEALTLGGDKLAVAGVLCIGEHGDYPYTPDTHQHMYPRRRFFDEVVATFKRCGQVVPVFNDKHLAYAWADAKHMVDTAQEMKIPLIAGSSLPVTWRSPELTLPLGCEIEEAMGVGYGDIEAYGFHALETLQCMVERRRGGETGVKRIEAVKGPEAIAMAEKSGRWSRELYEAALATTPPPPRPPKKPPQFRDGAAFFFIEYLDGLKATIAVANNVTNQFSFAARLKGQPKPVASCFVLEDWAPFGHFGYLLEAVEHTIRTGQPAYPVERTLLTTGVLDVALHSIVWQRPLDTPELAIAYEPVDWPYVKGPPPVMPKKQS